MVAAARETLQGRERTGVQSGDAEQLPFPAGSFDLVVSTSTFQWLESLDIAFAEAYRVLAPGGFFRFALFGAGTLRELKESYRSALRRHGKETVDRTHRFIASPNVADALDRVGFVCSRVWSEDETEFHPDVPALLRSLKRIGAGNASTDHAKSLAERRVMLTMMHLYGEKYGRDGSIPATYEVIYGWGLKKGSCSPPTGGEIMARGMSHATPSIERTD
jgi:malonyl-CoA O-methyltransferase